MKSEMGGTGDVWERGVVHAGFWQGNQRMK